MPDAVPAMDVSPGADLLSAAALADRPAGELLRLVLAAAITLVGVESAVLCDEDGAVLGAAPETAEGIERARELAADALRSLRTETGTPGTYVARISESPARILALRRRSAGEPFPEVAHAVAATLADIVRREGRQPGAAVDALTGLPTRAATLAHLDEVLHAALRAGRRFGVLYLDLDGFKAVNDAFGHAFGDTVLSDAGRRMRRCVRRGDWAGRLGGDEFVVIVQVHRDDDELIEAAQRFVEALRLRAEEHGEGRDVRASVGIALYPQDGTTIRQLLDHADEAMYAAKHAGGDTWRSYRDGVVQKRAQRRDDAPGPAELDGDRDLLVCYQPAIETVSGRVVGAEALVRWRHPSRGWLSPRVFAPRGGDAPFAEAIDAWVIGATSAAQRLLARDGHALRLHVNLSCIDTGTLEALAALGAEGCASLAVEVPEAVALDDPRAVGAFFARARALGVRVGLDAFGAQRLSFEMLAELPVDFIKLDRRLTRAAVADARWARIASAAVAAVRAVDAAPHADGIEHDEQIRWNAAAGVEAISGYLVAQPMTLPDFHHWMSTAATRTVA